jgi:hypothetical protein
VAVPSVSACRPFAVICISVSISNPSVLRLPYQSCCLVTPALLAANSAVHSFSNPCRSLPSTHASLLLVSVIFCDDSWIAGTHGTSVRIDRPSQSAVWIHGRISHDTANSLAAHPASATRRRSRQCLVRPPISRILHVGDGGSTTSPGSTPGRRRRQHRHDPQAPQTQISAILDRQWHRTRRSREKGLNTQCGAAIVWKKVKGRHPRSACPATNRSVAAWLPQERELAGHVTDPVTHQY